ncbi:MAG: hypothetical protein KF845_06400 [Cyclobacteriaceae bacterium]|nr:hypothetical protein [Cyclobacteriaceae bacterium]
MRYSRNIGFCFLLALLLSCDGDNSANTTGQGGSLTRFAISSNYLYVATNHTIAVYTIAENDFSHITDVPVGFGLETIIARPPYLYLGARDAMYIYSIANPESPQFVFRYAHIVSCDPVVVQGNRAYVTLRNTGNACSRGVNTLEIIDISNPNNPHLIRQLGMTSPGGLAIDGTCLFVCEGEHGLKVFDVTNDNINLLTSLTDVHAYDVIAQNGRLTLTGEDGVFQYNYDCSTSTLDLISKIPVQRAEL